MLATEPKVNRTGLGPIPAFLLGGVFVAATVADGIRTGTLAANLTLLAVVTALSAAIVSLHRTPPEPELSPRPWLGVGAVVILGAWWALAWITRTTAVNEFVNWAILGLVPLGLFIAATRGGAFSVRTLMKDLGLSTRSLGGDILWGAAAGVAMVAVIDLFPNAAGETMPHLPLLFSFSGIIRILIVAVIVLFTAGFYEELFFRAVLLRGLERLLKNSWAAVLLGAILFGLYHVPYRFFAPATTLQPSSTSGLFGPSVLLTLFENGLPDIVLGLLYLRRGRLIPCIVMHVTIDALALAPYVKIG